MASRSSERGAALVELALCTPMLLLLLLGAMDFSRVYYAGLELTTAARTGAEYGSLSLTNSSDTATMQSLAEAASPQITPYTVSTPTRTCACVNAAGTSVTAQACTSTCASASDHLVVTVTVTATKSFGTVLRIPGTPNTVNLTRTVSLRAQ